MFSTDCPVLKLQSVADIISQGGYQGLQTNEQQCSAPGKYICLAYICVANFSVCQNRLDVMWCDVW